MKVIATSISDVVLIKPDIFKDTRGFFMETFHRLRYADAGVPGDFVQDNLSCSRRGTLRGLHYQKARPQAKLIQVLAGEVFDVAVDLRAGSPTYGKWVAEYLSEENRAQLFIPAGFAHGFCVLSDTALFSYKCSDFYTPEDEGGVLWSDPDIGIEWPTKDPLLSEKDMKFKKLGELLPEDLPSGTSTKHQISNNK